MKNKYYIKRKKYIEKFKHLIESDSKGVLIGDTEAIYGSGKTTTLNAIYEELKNYNSRYIPVKINLQQYSFYHTNIKVENPNSLEALKQNYYDYKKLIIDLSALLYKALKFEEFTDVESKIEDFELLIIEENLLKLKESERFNKNTLNRINNELRIQKTGGINLGDFVEVIESNIQTGDIYSTINVNISIEEEYIYELIVESIEIMQKRIIRTYNTLINNSKIVFLADDFCWIIEQKIGKWFLELINQLNNTTIVLFRTVTEPKFLKHLKNVSTLQLTPFNLDEIKEYLRQNLRNHFLKTDENLSMITTNILNFSGGHPLLIELLTDVIDNTPNLNGKKLVQLFDELFGRHTKIVSDDIETLENINSTNELDKRITRLIEEIENKDILWQNDVKEGLKILSITRRLTHRILIEILKARLSLSNKNILESKARELATELANKIRKSLSKFSFVFINEFTPPDTNSIELEYTIHSRIRHCFEQKFLKEDPKGLQEYHFIVAGFYGAKELDKLDENLELIPEEDKFKYKILYRMENDKWQANLREWLYHLFHIEKRAKARLLFARVYLQAFDWYDYYIPFPFCKDLIKLWKQTQPDGEFIKTIDEFQKAYPRGFKKHGNPNCSLVPMKLRNLLESLNLRRKRKNLMNNDELMVVGLIYNYMGDGYRYSEKSDFLRAEKCYKKAINFFQDDWYKLWMISDLARLYFEQGKFVEAVKFANLSNDMVLSDGLQEQDHEVISQNYLTLGDIYLEKGNFDLVQINYAKALIHAYLFPFDNNVEIYTISWYNDIVKHIFEIGLKKLSDKFSKIKVTNLCLFFKNIWVKSSEDILEVYKDASFTAIQKLINAKKFGQLSKFILPMMPSLGKDNYEYHLEAVDELTRLIDMDETLILEKFAK